MNYDGEDYDVGEELSKRAVSSMQQAIKQSGGNGDQQQLVGQLGLNPETWLTDPKVDGDEKIGDADTYRITGAVDVKQLVPDILDAASKAQSLTGGATGQKVPTVTDAQLDKVAKDIEKLDVTIWTGKDDNILRQLKVDMTLKDGKDSLDGAIQPHPHGRERAAGHLGTVRYEADHRPDAQARRPVQRRERPERLDRRGLLRQRAGGLRRVRPVRQRGRERSGQAQACQSALSK